MATDVGTGTTITFNSGFFAEILSASWGGISREAIDISHMGTTGGRTKMPGDLYDPGELTVELHLDTATMPPVESGDVAEEITFTFPVGDDWVCDGFMTSFEFTDPLEDKMTATATITFTDEILV